MAEKDKREVARAPVEVRVEVSTAEGVTLCGEAHDVSLKGLFLPCDKMLPVGTRCDIVIVLEGGGEPVRLQLGGQVVQVRPQVGIGLEFEEVDLDSLEHLQRLVLYNAPDADQAQQEFHEHLGIKRAPQS